MFGIHDLFCVKFIFLIYDAIVVVVVEKCLLLQLF